MPRFLAQWKLKFLSSVCWSAPLCYPGFSFVSRPVLSLELGQVVRAAINTVHIQLEHSIIWIVCLSLLEFCWQRNETCFIAAYAFCVMCSFSYFTLHSYYRNIILYCFNSKSSRCFLIWNHIDLNAFRLLYAWVFGWLLNDGPVFIKPGVIIKPVFCMQSLKEEIISSPNCVIN